MPPKFGAYWQAQTPQTFLDTMTESAQKKTDIGYGTKKELRETSREFQDLLAPLLASLNIKSTPGREFAGLLGKMGGKLPGWTGKAVSFGLGAGDARRQQQALEKALGVLGANKRFGESSATADLYRQKKGDLKARKVSDWDILKSGAVQMLEGDLTSDLLLKGSKKGVLDAATGKPMKKDFKDWATLLGLLAT